MPHSDLHLHAVCQGVAHPECVQIFDCVTASKTVETAIYLVRTDAVCLRNL